jgi:CheY-like chemotaxis protein
VAHDFNNLLTVIRGYTQCLIADGNQTAAALDALGQVDAAAERAANLTSQMLVFSRKKRLQPEYLNINEVVPQLGKMLRRLLGEHIAMEFRYSTPALMVHADRAMIEQVVINLSVNSRDAMPEGGRLTIQTEPVRMTAEMAALCPKARPGEFACITISDDGTGITPESLEHLFEPFFTTKEPGKGTGLGLATVYGAIKQHDGWIDVQSQLGHGTTFKVYLPLTSEVSTTASSRYAARPAEGGTETILLVEDEDAVRSLASRILLRHGYQVVEARSGVEALKIWEREREKIDLLLTDMVMPDGISGWNLAQQLQRKNPRLKAIYTTGYSLDALVHDHTLKEGLNFLPKPYHPQNLVDTVRRCLDTGAGRWLGTPASLAQHAEVA